MRVFDKDKTRELFSYDIEKGYLKADKIFVAHHPEVPKSEGVYHYETTKIYPNGGKSIKRVYTVAPTEAKEAYDEYEDIQTYIPYTDKELAEIEIIKLKINLRDSDYKAIKFAEGVISETEYANTKLERENWRRRINELQSIYGL